jgi:DNA modification methylase
MYCDFYLPAGKVYIEFWGMEIDAKYCERKKEKIAIYEQYGFSLIELNDQDISNLDDVLPRLLLKHGITTY